MAACFFSRYCTDHFTYPSPWEHPDLFVEKVVEEVERRKVEVLIPVHREGYILSRYKNLLDRHVAFPYSPYSKVISVSDKKKLVETAGQAGVRIPKTIFPVSMRQVQDASLNLGFPVVIKLRRGHGGIGMAIIRDPSQLSDAYLRTLRKFDISSQEDYPIIQEFIQGEYESLGMLFNHGKPRAEFSTHSHPERVEDFRYIYGSGGDRGPVEVLSRLGEHLRWHGVLHGGFLIEKDTGLTYLVEINPRFWGGLSLACRCGVEFPYLLYRMAIEGDVEPVLDYEKGLRSRWLLGDLSNIPKYVLGGQWNQVHHILTCRVALDFWDPGDPIPFFTLPIYYVAQLFRTGTLQPLVEKY